MKIDKTRLFHLYLDRINSTKDFKNLDSEKIIGIIADIIEENKDILIINIPINQDEVKIDTDGNYL